MTENSLDYHGSAIDLSIKPMRPDTNQEEATMRK
jgi:hypothetical protein